MPVPSNAGRRLPLHSLIQPLMHGQETGPFVVLRDREDLCPHCKNDAQGEDRSRLLEPSEPINIKILEQSAKS